MVTTAGTNASVYFRPPADSNIVNLGIGKIEWIKYDSINNSLIYPILGNYADSTASVTMRERYYNDALTGNDYNDALTLDPATGIQTVERGWDWDFNTVTQYRVYRMGTAAAWATVESAFKPSPTEQMRRIIANRSVPGFIRNLKSLDKPFDIREIRARQTLHRVIGDDKYRSFLRKGFITVRAKSGRTYQIFPGHGITRVFECGRMIERLCVVLSGDFPPTDSVIMRYLLIINNEQQFRSLAVIHPVVPVERRGLLVPNNTKSLPELFKMLKAAAA